MGSAFHWSEHDEFNKNVNAQKIKRFNELKEEIETSDFEMFDGRDIDHFSSEMTANDVTGKKWNNVDIIDLNMKQNPDKTKFDYMDCFIDSDSDDIMNFY